MKSAFVVRSLSALALSALSAVACGPPKVRPVSFPDPEVSCPAGLLSWNLEIQDQRAEPEASEKMINAVRDGIQKSFPGCHWSAPGDETATITIAVHRFAAVFNDRYYDSAVDWTVTVRNASGRTISEFDANEQETRPAYSGADAEVPQRGLSQGSPAHGQGSLPGPPNRVNASPGGDGARGRRTARCRLRDRPKPMRASPFEHFSAPGSPPARQWNGSRTASTPEEP